MNRRIFTMRQVVCLFLLLAIATGLVMVTSVTVVAAEKEPPLFYPPPPNEPRLQYLKKYSSRLDVSAKSSRMRDLIFGGEEFEGHDIVKPYGVAMFEGALYVVDTEKNGYVVFDLAAEKTRFVKGSGGGAMTKPINITIDSDGTRYVTDTQRDVVIVFDRNDRYVRTLGEVGQFKPVDVAIHGDRLYVTDIRNMKIHVLNKVTGEILFEFGEAGSKPGQLYHPTSLVIGHDETLYVTDTTNFRIQHFTLEGEHIRTVGNIGVNPGQFSRPKGVAVDREGRIYVVDAAFQNVQVLDDDGTPLTVFGSSSTGRGAINLPTAVRIDYDNLEYFQKYAAPGFELDYVIFVASQFGANKVAVFGFGAMKGELAENNEGNR
ncbi:MAG: SMP-30/gluconolactonase/LRE family protein [Gammaproteobacteria bacterium]|nr:SMP-30/gluconolactonase/LRE family protein [Gammaproteobacteria bacterium]